ncbi:hypothetical protein [Arthrobacter sp. A2-55]|nr:hypothetical protein [Arthrobacter sp. A2-55]
MSLMTAHGGNAYWYDFVDLEDDHDGYRIDLDKAVNWVPSFE